MVTIYDIAAKAGVSGSTVSRALNGSRLVSDAVRERVQEIAKELGFEKRNVRRHRERTILNIRLVLPHHEAPERALFFDLSQLIAGLRQGFEPTATNLMCDLGGPEFVPFPHKKGGDTDAFVFAFHLPGSRVIAELRERGVPFVILNRAITGLPCITADHAQGMRDLVAHTTSGGRRIKPCLLSIESSNEVFTERRQTLKEALANAGIPFPDSAIHDFESVKQITPEVLEKIVDRYDTLYCINDIVGTAVLTNLAIMRVPVPEKCQVTGFDDSPLRRLTRPLLTTVEMPVFELGRHAGKRLASEVIDGQASTPLERLRGSLLVGGSTLPAVNGEI